MKHYSENELRNILGKDMHVSEEVNDRLNEVYSQIRHSQKKIQKSHRNKLRQYIAGASAAVAAASIFCISNPAIAAKLPLVGHLFEELSDLAEYPGDYSQVGEPLAAETDTVYSTDANTNTETDSQSVTIGNNTPSEYTVSKDDLALTLSEVYCNEAALYLTMEMTSEEPFEPCMVDQNGKAIMAVSGTSNFSFNQQQLPFLNYLSGKFTDENTYIAMYRYDLREALLDDSAFNEALEQGEVDELTDENYYDLVKTIELPESFTLDIAFNQIIGTKEDVPTIYEVAGISQPTEEELMAMSEEEWQQYMNEISALVPDYYEYPSPYENFWYDGPYEFHLDITVDHERTRTYPVDTGENKEFYVESVTVTPFELFIKQTGRENSADYVLYVLDADGQHIGTGTGGGYEDMLAIDDHDISKIDIYYLPYDKWESIKAASEADENDKTLKELCDEACVYHQEVSLD